MRFAEKLQHINAHAEQNPDAVRRLFGTLRTGFTIYTLDGPAQVIFTYADIVYLFARHGIDADRTEELARIADKTH